MTDYDRLMKQTTDLSAYSKSLPIAYETWGSWRQKWAMWKADRAAEKDERLKLRHRLHRLFAAVLGGGG